MDDREAAIQMATFSTAVGRLREKFADLGPVHLAALLIAHAAATLAKTKRPTHDHVVREFAKAVADARQLKELDVNLMEDRAN